MRCTALLPIMLFAALASPIAAEDKAKAKAGTEAGAKPAASEKPIMQRDVSAVDVVATPVSDLNLKKQAIPQLLLDAQEDPYTLTGMTSCAKMASAVTTLDQMLGDDLDIDALNKNKMQAGRVAQSVVGAFIPFQGVIREVSGANAQDRKLRAAVLAGSARRAFLKGTGMARGCSYPARPATTADAARVLAAYAAADPKNKDKQAISEKATAELEADKVASGSKKGKRRSRHRRH